MKLPILPKNVQMHKTPPAKKTGRGSLTRREWQIVEFLLKDFTHTRIALQLGISRGTVVKHVISIKQKLGLEGKAADALKSWFDEVIGPAENTRSKR